MTFTRLALVASLSVAACARAGTPQVTPVPRGGLEELSLNQRVATVPANANFRVALNDALSSETSYPGQTFTATLLTALMTNDARMAAPTGSQVNGHVVAVENGSKPQVELAFDTIQTPGGLQRIEAHAKYALDAPFALGSQRDATTAEADGVIRPGGGAIGGGPPAEGTQPTSTTKVVVPKSAQLELVLVSPLTVILPEKPQTTPMP